MEKNYALRWIENNKITFGIIVIVVLLLSFALYNTTKKPASFFDSNDYSEQIKRTQEASAELDKIIQQTKPQEAKLEITQFKCTYDGYSDILGHQAKYLGLVKNKGNTLEKYVDVNIDFYNNGEFVGSDSAYVSGTDIPAGQTRSFEGEEYELFSKFTDCEARVDSGW